MTLRKRWTKLSGYDRAELEDNGTLVLIEGGEELWYSQAEDVERLRKFLNKHAPPKAKRKRARRS